MLGLAALDYQVCRKPAKLDLIEPPHLRSPYRGLSANSIYLREVEERVKRYSQRDFQNQKLLAKEKYENKKNEEMKQFQARNLLVRNLAIQERKNIIARSVNWRIKSKRIEEEEISRLNTENSFGLWMWKIPDPINRKARSVQKKIK